MGIPIRRSQVLPLRAGPLGLSQLGTSFFSSQAERSTSWHSSHVHRIDVARCNACDPGTGPVDAWTTRTHGLICSAGRRPACINPSQPRLHGLVHRFAFGLNRKCLSHLRDTTSIRTESWTHWDSNPGHPPCKGGTLPLSYGPTPLVTWITSGNEVLALVVQRCPIGQRWLDRTKTAQVGQARRPGPGQWR